MYSRLDAIDTRIAFHLIVPPVRFTPAPFIVEKNPVGPLSFFEVDSPDQQKTVFFLVLCNLRPMGACRACVFQLMISPAVRIASEHANESQPGAQRQTAEMIR